MEIDIITKEDDRINSISKKIDQMKKQIKAIEKDSHPLFNGERYLADAELSAKLSISRRTLQEWRIRNIIRYIKLDGKILYRESDIEKVLNDRYSHY